MFNCKVCDPQNKMPRTCVCSTKFTKEEYKIAYEKAIMVDKEVEAILKSTREFAQERTLTQEEADALDKAMARPAAKNKGRDLPSRQPK